MSSAYVAHDSWGPLSEPIHGAVPEGNPPWKDNAYLAFWDTTSHVYGVFHASTSPNAEGRRARVSIDAGDGVVEIIEDLAPGTFDSASISFDLDETIRISGAELSGELTVTPRFALADYSNNETIPALVKDQPLRHYQRGARVTGTISVGGRELSIDGVGMRDRTWGYRDESVSIAEYVAVLAVADDFAFTVMRFLGADGKLRTEGFFLTEESTAVTGMEVTRDASGLFAAGRFTIAGRPPLEWRTNGRPAGFWVPMGWERTGPTMAAYDEFCLVRDHDGATAVAMVEQGSVRQVF